MKPTRLVVSVTTDAAGAATAYSDVVSGEIVSIRYVKTDFADGSTMTMTAEATGESIWSESAVNASATRAPRQATHSITGAASLYAAAGQAVLDRISLSDDRVKIVIASGGNKKTGTFHIVVQ